MLEDKEILDLFYNEFMPEASIGKVNCYFKYRIIFDSELEGKKLKNRDTSEDLTGAIVPVLIINNKKRFDQLLIEYIKQARGFYSEKDYMDEAIPKGEVLPEKKLMVFLWLNASFEDFSNPCEFLQKRINYFNILPEITKLDTIISFNTEQFRFKLDVVEDYAFMETPYKLCISLSDENNREYHFPELKFGIDEKGLVTFFSQQKGETEDDELLKRNLDTIFKNGIKENAVSYLRNVTPAYVVALNFALAYFKAQGYSKFAVNSILIERWNEKRLPLDNPPFPELLSKQQKEELSDNLDQIQFNLTQKLINTFARICTHYRGINIDESSLDSDSLMYFKIEDIIEGNNNFLSHNFDKIQSEIELCHSKKKI